VTALLEDSKGNFWVGTAEDGLHIMNRETGTFIRYTYDPSHPEQLSRPAVKGLGYGADHIRFIVEDPKGFVWIGTIGNGINRYDPESKTVRHFGTEEKGINKLPLDHFWSHLQTKEGLLWIGGWLFEGGDHEAGALLKINLSPIGLFEGHLNMPRIQSFGEDNSGNIFMVRVNNLIQVDSLGKEKILYQFNYSNQTFLSDINIDEAGNLWMSSNRGLLFYNSKTNSLESFIIDEKESAGDGKPIITSDFFSPDSLLVGAEDGLYVFHLNEKKFTKIELPAYNRENTDPNFAKIFIDSQKFLWVSSYTEDLKRIDLSANKIVDYPVLRDSLDWVTTIYEDQFNNLYIGNNHGGLRNYDRVKDKFTLVKDQTRLLNEETKIFGISRTKDSVLWLSNVRGLIKYDLTSNKAFLLGEIWGIVFPNTSTIFKSSKGDLYMGKDGPGYIKFRPEDFKKSTGVNEKPFVSNFKMDDQLIPIHGGIDKNQLIFNHDQNNIALTLGYINYDTGIKNTSFQYKLEKYDEDWRVAGKGDEISYFKLTPGDYTFVFNVIDIYGESLENTLSFKIKSPWWFTWYAYSIYGLLIALAAWSTHRFQKAKILRMEQERIKDKELAHAKEIEKAYSELKATQTQLIQSEKMASLGELTAGIAHEIQNPLNFVNNFSEVSKELIEEMLEEIQKGDLGEVNALAKDIIQNLEKIHHHGQRADGIVKGMLQHSRASSGEKEPTDINVLADEYLRLAYHGLRAKDKSFNATLDTDFDKKIGKINIIPQDMGRVILNLITNAFHAVQERASFVNSYKEASAKLEASEDDKYQPTVGVSTKKVGDMIEIEVKDNGNGIPKKIIQKIFEPFFTTKPSGRGTGLGLSMSYEIVTKAHRGELKVASKEGEGTTFTIVLPIVKETKKSKK
jgi:signal transduction histidine kinase